MNHSTKTSISTCDNTSVTIENFLNVGVWVKNNAFMRADICYKNTARFVHVCVFKLGCLFTDVHASSSLWEVLIRSDDSSDLFRWTLTFLRARPPPGPSLFDAPVNWADLSCFFCFCRRSVSARRERQMSRLRWRVTFFASPSQMMYELR